KLGPAPARLRGYLREARERGVLVRLVRERGHTLATLGVIAHDTEEADDRTRARCGGPRSGRVRGQDLVGERDPVGGGRRVPRPGGSSAGGETRPGGETYPAV